MQVSDAMTRDLVTITRDATVAEALRRAEKHDLHHLLIVGDDGLVGIVCVCDLRERPMNDHLETCITRAPDVIEPGRSLAEAAHEFVALGVSCFPVCAGGKLVGVITRGDLRRTVAGGANLPASFVCSYCGGTRHVRPDPGNDSMTRCLDCTYQSIPAAAKLHDEGTKD